MLLLPSLEEGIANVVLEAMALGVPVISTDCGGMNEVVKHGETGWLIPVLNLHTLASTIIHFKNASIEKKVFIVNNAYKHLKAYFDREHAIVQFDKFYN